MLGLAKISRGANRHVFFRCGAGVLLIFNANETNKPPGQGALPVPPHGTTGNGHACFRLSGENFEGKLTRIAAGVDHATRSLLVEAEIPNPQEKLRPGYFAHVTGVMGEEPALFIPRSGLSRYAGVERIFIMKENLAVAREVKSGIEEGDMVEIAEGLAENERVIVSEIDRLADGMKVQQQVAEAQ